MAPLLPPVVRVQASLLVNIAVDGASARSQSEQVVLESRQQLLLLLTAAPHKEGRSGQDYADTFARSPPASGPSHRVRHNPQAGIIDPVRAEARDVASPSSLRALVGAAELLAVSGRVRVAPAC